MATKTTKTQTTKATEIHVSLPTQWDETIPQNIYGSLTIKFTYKPTKGFRSIDLKKRRTPLLTLSITGTVRDQRGAEWSGQCTDVVRKVWGAYPEVVELCDLWDRWHLNDLRAGSRKQSDALRGKKNRTKHDHYTWACNYLKRKGLLTDQGYRYGNAWLFEEIPATVVARIKTLAKKANCGR